MKAVWYERTGLAHVVLVAGEMPTPAAGVGEVRIKLAASGVNPADCYRRRGDIPMEFPAARFIASLRASHLRALPMRTPEVEKGGKLGTVVVEI